MPTAVDSAFDIAFWFADTALNHNEYLQPQKLHRLLFIAQAYYAVATSGKKLMPATFVASEMGPIEPNVYTAFSKGRPDMEIDMFLPPEVEDFLRSIWARFGHHSAERLTKMTKATLAYKKAYKRARRAEIPHETMRLDFARAEETPALDQVMKPKVAMTQKGRAVKVQAWNPAALAKAKKAE